MDRTISLQYSFLLLIMYISHCSSDISFNYFKSHIQTFLDNTPKTWHNYIRIFLYRYSKNSQVENGILLLNLLKMYKYSIIFLKLKNKSLNSTNLFLDVSPYKIIKTRGIFKGITSYKFNVTWTSGQIYMFYSKLFRLEYQIYFNLNLKLKLNVTFIVLYLRGLTVHCSLDKLEIINSKDNNEKYKYCGYHSKVNIYPKFNNVLLGIYLSGHKSFEMDMIFSVTDKSLIFNKLDFPLSEHGKNNLIKQHCYKIGGTYYLISFLIHLTEIYRVKVNIVNSANRRYIIYDGPGYIFDVLIKKNKDSTYIASTHQCLLQFFTPNLIQTGRNHVDFNKVFPNRDTIKINITSHSETLLHIPFNNSQQNWCNILLQTNLTGFHFNYKVLNISVSSPMFSPCFFQGLYIGEIWDGNYSTVDEICTKITTSFPLTLKTRGNYSVITLFWYKGHSSINSSLAVTVMKCKTVNINLCIYYSFCSNPNPKCNTYLKTITKNTMLNLSARKNDSRGPVLHFSLSDGDCVLLFLTAPLMFSKKPQTYDLFSLCAISLVSQPGGDKINYIDVSLEKPNYVEVIGQKPCLTSRNRVCHGLSNGTNTLEFHRLVYFSRMKVHSGEIFEEINAVHLSMMYKTESRRWGNIMLIGSKETQGMQYGFSVHTFGGSFGSYFLQKVLGSKHMTGTDWLLSINSNFTLLPQHKDIFCDFILYKVLEFNTIVIPVTFGKCFKYLFKICYKFLQYFPLRIRNIKE